MTQQLLSAYTATTCLGHGLAATLAALEVGRSGLTPCAFETVTRPWIGEVLRSRSDAAGSTGRLRMPQQPPRRAGAAPTASPTRRRRGRPLRPATYRRIPRHQHFRHPANRAGLPPSRSGERRVAGRFSLSHHPQHLFGGRFSPRAIWAERARLVVSTACSSSAKVFAAAARMMAAGRIDAAVVGGVDSLCLTTLYGFNSLELLSPGPAAPTTRPRRHLHRRRRGLRSAGARRQPIPPRHRAAAGRGRIAATPTTCRRRTRKAWARDGDAAALRSAGLHAGDIDYINLHGTATPSNDAAEGKAVAAVFGNQVPCSSTKGATGHTLGAAGGVEAVICALALSTALLPAPGHAAPDPAMPLDYRSKTATPGSRAS